VVADRLNVRESPSTNSEVIASLSKDEIVTLVKIENENWAYISYYGIEGFVSLKYILSVDESEKYKDWEKSRAKTGDNPECENIRPNYDYKIDNELIVKVGYTADVVVKLMELNGVCIRIAYIKSGENYSMKNIPEGIYYLKIAYGKDLRIFTKENQCIAKFLRNPSYEKGKDILDFNIIHKPNTIIGEDEYTNWEVPSFELSLNIEYSKYSKHENTFHSEDISEMEFNK